MPLLPDTKPATPAEAGTHAILAASVVLCVAAIGVALEHSSEKYPQVPLTGDYIIHGMR